jgi:PiT family inorganic phosphate transporter
MTPPREPFVDTRKLLTHVLSSAVGGTMAANGSGLQWGTVRNLLMAWVITLPVSIILSGTLYWIFHSFV